MSGCAANVARNLSELAEDLAFQGELMGFRGPDVGSELLVQLLTQSCPRVRVNLVEDDRWTTPLKTRFIAGSQHQLLRVDEEERLTGRAHALPTRWRDELASMKLVICQDYSKGLLQEAFLQDVIHTAKAKNIPVFVDPNRNTPPSWYRGATLLTPNIEETERLWGRSFERNANEEKILIAAEEIVKKLEIDGVLITRGKHGMTGFHKSGQHFSFPSFAREVFDVTGAGDTVIAVLSVFCAFGADLDVAAYIANAAASVVVSKVGTAVATLAEIEKVIYDLA